MTAKDCKRFDLSVNRPSVLLFGNGIIREEGRNWNDTIQTFSDGSDEAELICHSEAPNILKLTTVAGTNDNERQHQYRENIRLSDNTRHLQALLELPFDAVLTTNFTYEAETLLYPRYESLSLSSKRNYAHTIGREPKRAVDTRFLLHTFNRLKDVDLWHIHGELRLQSSIVFELDEYARLIRRITDYNAKNANRYQEDYVDLAFSSWIDYLIMGDVYVVGQGLDYSELDLWWLLNRRRREKANVGRYFYYAPQETSVTAAKKAILKRLNVTHLDMGITADNSAVYDEFYKRAIDDIRKQLGGNVK